MPECDLERARVCSSLMNRLMAFQEAFFAVQREQAKAVGTDHFQSLKDAADRVWALREGTRDQLVKHGYIGAERF